MERLRVKFRFIASAVLLGVIGLVVIAGCGGGSSSSSSGEGGSSSFASGAEGACSKADKEIVALGTPQQEQVLEYLESTEDIIAELHDDVESLRPSGAAEKAYTQALGESVIVLNHMANAARNENYDAVREISDELIEFKVGELAEAANLKTCAEVPEATS